MLPQDLPDRLILGRLHRQGLEVPRDLLDLVHQCRLLPQPHLRRHFHRPDQWHPSHLLRPFRLGALLDPEYLEFPVRLESLQHLTHLEHLVDPEVLLGLQVRPVPAIPESPEVLAHQP